ncbi:MAG: PIN domain-containing protein [Proteobacteria bacterium]|nr:PIN domain-containing protein [Pseudomonadota bacterium]MBU4470991.1 PIN domain-containing protein [Pseudomonadota bacterium]MCG2753591.1 PIN domain-containing protein [Desulfobacteraceae bacterium]
MIAVDTNILVYAHREDSEWHDVAYECLRSLAEGRESWAIPWPCIHEFLAISTHPKIFSPPTPLEQALFQVDAWVESPSVVMLQESKGYWAILKIMIQTGRIQGPMIHDARIAALCRFNGISELWSADRDFKRFPGLVVENPLIRQ